MIAFLHFNSELLIYRTTKLGKGWLGPAVVSSTSTPAQPALKSPKRASRTLTLAGPEHQTATSLVWMTLQRDFYLA